MNEISSKICHKCFSPQEPASRFCDNCGNRFVVEVGNGDVFSETKTFMRQQVRETRPLFWASILVVGTLSVFGFAKAGVFDGPLSSVAPLAAFQSKTTHDEIVPKHEINKSDTTGDALIDSAGNVFDMSHQSAGGAAEPKTRSAERPAKAKLKNEQVATTAVTAEVPGDDLKVAFAEPAAPKAKDSAESAAAKNYVRGPMGGCFYLTASGGKRYVDRSMCK